jgi:class 3 adenylate cyclase/ActR/RegA family two-component response regulator
MHQIIAGKKVLVVDDLATIRRVVQGVLAQNGAHILEADCAADAIRIANKQSVDAFLLDIQLPGTNGIELCRSIRAMDRYRNAPIMFVTAMDERRTLQQALEAGGDDFIPKPIDPVILRARLGNLFQKTEYFRRIELFGLSLHRYVSPRTEEMARIYAKTGVLPPPRKHEVSVLFTDVRGFTELSQQMEPDVLFQRLSEFLAEQVSLVYTHGGYVDKFAGDGMMAVFDGEEMTLKSCLCALDILEFSKDRVEQQAGKIHQLGMGIHGGHAMIGNLGSSEHLDYTLVGRTVNLAARLCGAADRLSIAVSQTVRDALADDPRVQFSRERRATIRGFEEPILIYDLTRGISSS